MISGAFFVGSFFSRRCFSGTSDFVGLLLYCTFLGCGRGTFSMFLVCFFLWVFCKLLVMFGHSWVIDYMAVGQNEKPQKKHRYFSLFFIFPIGFFGYPVFLTHSLWPMFQRYLAGVAARYRLSRSRFGKGGPGGEADG